ncbi:hypothetical protein WA026_018715 [Henosepilachna vigintioctopunctata]|uniref:RNase H type-1 domain-containing protein n=1 Tax=Henosepilachna vigintioctopunctata TaxID=420089 RepID=A0AAW1TVX9_9CUCU
MGHCSLKNSGVLDKILVLPSLKIAMGLMKSTATNIILAEANELPLKHRRLWLSTKFLSKLERCENDNVFLSINTLKEWNQVMPMKPPSIIFLFVFISELEYIEKDQTFSYYKFCLKSHYSEIKMINLGLEKHNIYNSRSFLVKVNKELPNFCEIFTDALETNRNSVVGVYSQGLVDISEGIPSFYPCRTAELIAIKKAVDIIKNKTNITRTIIFSD